MLLYFIPSFQRDIENLISKGKSGYGNCVEDTRAELERFNSVNDLFNSARTLSGPAKPRRILKVRISNSSQNLGKSSGYRLICYANSDTDSLYLLHIYPKLGRMKKGNVLANEIEKLVQELSLCRTNNSGIQSFPPDIDGSA